MSIKPEISPDLARGINLAFANQGGGRAQEMIDLLNRSLEIQETTATTAIFDEEILQLNNDGTTANLVGAGVLFEGDAAAVVGYMRVTAASTANLELKAPTGSILTIDVNAASTLTLAQDLAVSGAAPVTIDQPVSTTSAVVFASVTLGATTLVSSILDEDAMGSDSATALATQQSIKAYVDAQVASIDTWDEIMHNGSSFTVLNTENISATITQNDITNNPAALIIANTGSGADITLPNSSSITNGVAVFATSIEANSAVLTGGVNTFAITNGTASIDVAAAATVDIDTDLTVNSVSVVLDQDLQASASPTFVNLTITSFAANWTNAGRTVADLGIVTTVDIDGGTIDGTTIGGSSAAAITGTTITGTVITASTSIVFDEATNDLTLIAVDQVTGARQLTIPDLGAADEVILHTGTNAGTIDDLGTVTTADINGGSIDGSIIGAASAAAATVSTLSVEADSLILDSDDAGGFTTTLTQSATAATILTLPDGTGTLARTTDSIPTSSTLATVLVNGASTGATDLTVTAGQSIISSSGGGYIDLRFGAEDDYVWIDNKSGAGTVAILELRNTYSALQNYAATGKVQLLSNNYQFEIDEGSSKLVVGKFNNENIVIVDNSAGNKTSSDNDREALFLNARNCTINTGVTNSAIVAAVGLTATQDDTLYTANIDIASTFVTSGTTTTSGAGAVAITGSIHEVTTTGAGNALTLVDGAEGQVLRVVYVAEGGGGDTAILTPTNLGGADTTITFNDLGDAVTLLFTAGAWYGAGVKDAVFA